MEILATAGVVGIAALCESARATGFVRSNNFDYSVKRSLRNLENKDLVVKVKTAAGPKWQLTAKGQKTFEKNNLDQIKIAKPAVWDGKWRIVIFDIPENLRWTRHILRRKLKELGFTLIQKSAFTVPWPCLEEINKLVEVLNLSPHVKFIEGNYLSNDQDLKIKYDLS